MNLFKKRVETVVANMPEGYKFEFETIAINVESLLSDTRTAGFRWYLFKENQLVDEGETSIWMHSEHPEVEMFLYGRRRALNHAQKVREENNFLFSDMNVVHVLPQSMVMERRLFNNYANL